MWDTLIVPRWYVHVISRGLLMPDGLIVYFFYYTICLSDFDFEMENIFSFKFLIKFIIIMGCDIIIKPSF